MSHVIGAVSIERVLKATILAQNSHQIIERSTRMFFKPNPVAVAIHSKPARQDERALPGDS
jgi:hypothetical protein